MKDACLVKFESEWDSSETLSDKAIIVFNLVQYCKLRYRGVQKLAEDIGPKVDYLEEHVSESSGKEFLKVQRVIAHARREIADSRQNYGSGFKRPLADSERESVRRDYPSILLSPDPDLEPQIDSDPVNRIDLFAFGLGDDPN